MLIHKTKVTACWVADPDGEEYHTEHLSKNVQDFEIMMQPIFTWPAVDFRQAHEERKGKR